MECLGVSPAFEGLLSQQSWLQGEVSLVTMLHELCQVEDGLRYLWQVSVKLSCILRKSREKIGEGGMVKCVKGECKDGLMKNKIVMSLKKQKNVAENGSSSSETMIAVPAVAVTLNSNLS